MCQDYADKEVNARVKVVFHYAVRVKEGRTSHR